MNPLSPRKFRPRSPLAVSFALTLTAVLAAVTLPAASASAAPSAAARAATPPGLSCHTGKHNNDEYTGFALCENRGSATTTFWVHLVCGWAPDVDGTRVTVRPGQVGQSDAHCSILGSGIGEISVRP